MKMKMQELWWRCRWLPLIGWAQRGEGKPVTRAVWIGHHVIPLPRWLGTL